MRFSRVLFPFYFDLWPSKPLFDIRKFQKYVGIIVDLFVGTSRFVFFFCLICCFLDKTSNAVCFK